jgi:5-formyltetrahydrofolate cyclo-ligase
MNKTDLRKHYLSLRSQLTSEEINSGSEALSQKVLGYLATKPTIKHIHLFLSIAKLNEVNTFPLVKKLQEAGFKVYTSILDGGMLKTVVLSEGVELIEDKWGIPVPKSPVFADDAQIQLVLVPFLVFDLEGYRIGYGKGYYDSFLAGLSNNVLKIGLGFFPAVESIHPEAHDIPLDACFTPDKDYKFSP